MKEREKFEKWWDSTHKYPVAGSSPYEVQGAWDAWKALTSTRKPYGYGIVDSEGLHVDYATTDKAASISTQLHFCMRPDDGPYRVVELFYEDSES